MKPFFILLFLTLSQWCTAQTVDYTQGLSIWFNRPNSLQGKAVWFGGNERQWKGENVPETAGNTVRNPDQAWESRSLPVGNGSIGGNVMGSITTERITFNEKTLWRGGPNNKKGASYYWDVNKESSHWLPKIRQAFEAGNDKMAAQWTQQHFNGKAAYSIAEEKPFRFGNFTTGGELLFKTDIQEQGISNYQRVLSLDSALAVVQFSSQGVKYQRKCFVSFPQNVMVVRFTADKPGKQQVTFSYGANPVIRGKMVPDGPKGLVYKGTLMDNDMAYVLRVHALNKGGTVQVKKGELVVTGADEVSFLITADTDYKMNFDPDFTNNKTYVGMNPMKTTAETMHAAEKMSYEDLFAVHVADYTKLFKRVSLNLNGAKQVQKPTFERLEHYRKGAKDFGLEELYFQFGRYLLIASSRPGNMPANLQGMWHNNVDGPWRMDYHNNINVQMNYWPACATNLTECMLPYVDYIRSLVKPGAVTAKAYYDARGWTASISGNIFGFTAPLNSQDMSWNLNPAAGPWLATQVWEYFDYTRDVDFLRQVGYPIIKGAANFAVDFLWKKKNGVYVAAPSTSPEHGPIDQGATFVHAVVREIILNAMDAARVLHVDKREIKEWKKVLKHLAPYRIGRYGQLMEWSKDIDNPKDRHRHVNHLFGLHPGHTIAPGVTPELAKAARVVLEHRGDGATGWSMGWKLNQWARLKDGNHAYMLLGNLLKNGTLDNLWDTHPPFQIDGNFGGTAGMTELLLQSHMGFVDLLPALPKAWSEGCVTGLLARGGFVVELKWSNGELLEAILLSKAGQPCVVKYGDKKCSFETKKGRRYKIVYLKGKLVFKENRK